MALEARLCPGGRSSRMASSSFVWRWLRSISYRKSSTEKVLAFRHSCSVPSCNQSWLPYLRRTPGSWISSPSITMTSSRNPRFRPSVTSRNPLMSEALSALIRPAFATASFRLRKDHGLFAKSYLKERLANDANRILQRYFGAPPRYLEGVVDIDFHFRRLREACGGARGLVIMFPHLYDLQDSHDILTQPARDAGFVVRDLLEDFRRHPLGQIHMDLIHPTAYGNGVAAQAAFDELLSSGMINSNRRSQEQGS